HFFSSHPHPTTALYTLPLHDALPISPGDIPSRLPAGQRRQVMSGAGGQSAIGPLRRRWQFTVLLFKQQHAHAENIALGQSVLQRSEEHTSELQSRENLVCRLLLEKKK